MKRYIRAEFELYKKNRLNLILSFCGLFIFALLLLFSGIAEISYCIIVSVVGYVVSLLFIIALYFSPASFWQDRKKVVISSEQLVLTLGESKRMYLKIRMLALGVIYIGILGVIAVMQIPAALIAGEHYSVWGFALEIEIFSALLFLGALVWYLLPERLLTLGVPLWSGFCGGIAGGSLGEMEEYTKQQAFDYFLVIALVAVLLGLLAILYRWFKTIRDERGGIKRKPS